MPATALKAAVTGNVANNGQLKTLAHLMANPKTKVQMVLALPKYMTADRLTYIAPTETRKVPTLVKCNQESFFDAMMQYAQLGLEPGNVLGHAYPLPLGNGKMKDGLSNVQLIIGYRGMIDPVRRPGQIASLTARIVHQDDQFSYHHGLDEDVQHVSGEGEHGVMTHVYAIAKLKDGSVQFEVMSKVDVDKVRATSKASGNGPWATHYEEMAKKTVIHQLFKYLSVSIELQIAVILDERVDTGLDQDNAPTLTGEHSVVNDQFQDQVPNGVNTGMGEITEPASGQQPDTGTDELNLE